MKCVRTARDVKKVYSVFKLGTFFLSVSGIAWLLLPTVFMNETQNVGTALQGLFFFLHRNGGYINAI